MQQNLQLSGAKSSSNHLKEGNGCFAITLLNKFLIINPANLFLRRRDGRAVECGGLENR
jgi:hypothetical protein